MKRAEGFLLKKIADEYVIVPTGKKAEEVNEVFTLTGTAAYIYSHVEEATGIDGLIQMISRDYHAEEEAVAEDVRQVVGVMEEKGLLE